MEDSKGNPPGEQHVNPNSKPSQSLIDIFQKRSVMLLKRTKFQQAVDETLKNPDAFNNAIVIDLTKE